MNLLINLDQLERLPMEEIQQFLKGQIEARTSLLRHAEAAGWNTYTPITKVYAHLKRTKRELAQLRKLHNQSLKW